MDNVALWYDPVTFTAVNDLLDVAASFLRVEHVLDLHPGHCTCSCGFMAIACELVSPSVGLTLYLIEQALSEV